MTERSLTKLSKYVGTKNLLKFDLTTNKCNLKRSNPIEIHLQNKNLDYHNKEIR